MNKTDVDYISTRIRDFLGHAEQVKRVLFLNKDTAFASGSEDGEIMLWDRDTETATRTLRGHTHSITDMIEHDDMMITGSSDKTARIWDLRTGGCLRVLEGHSQPVSFLKFNPDYSLLRTACGQDGELCIWKKPDW